MAGSKKMINFCSFSRDHNIPPPLLCSTSSHYRYKICPTKICPTNLPKLDDGFRKEVFEKIHQQPYLRLYLPYSK